MRILGISGSLRRDSHNTSLLRAAAMSLPSGVELELFDGLGDLPHYNADIDDDLAPQAVVQLREAIAGADGVLIATPDSTGRSPACSRTRSTSPRDRSPTTRCAACPSPWSAPRPVCSARSGRRRKSARFSRPSALT